MSDSLSILIGFTTLIATIVLGLIAIVVARVLAFPIERINEVERELAQQKENLFGMRLLAKTVLRSSRDSNLFNDYTRRTLGTILENPDVLKDSKWLCRAAKHYNERTSEGLRLMPQQYSALELFTCDDEIEFDDALNAFCEMGADVEDRDVIEFSIEFLDSLTALIDDERCAKVEVAIAELKRLRIKNKPIHATWTGSSL